MSTITLAIMLASAGPTSQDDGDTRVVRDMAVRDAPMLALAEQPVLVSAPPSEVGAQAEEEPAAAPPEVPGETVPPPAGAPADTPAEASAPAEGDNVIIVNASPRHIRADPLSAINVATFEAVTAVDKAVVAPVAGNYEKIVPKPVRNGLRNVLINLAEPIVFVNYLLQFKPGKAMETLGRFGINSTIGVAGLFDMAKRKPFHLPYRQNGFANTFGYHGIGNGPYLFLPVLGPTTARDLVGRVLDLSIVPTIFGSPFNKPVYAIGTGTVKSLNDRVEFDEQITASRAAADPYVATRDFYLKRRQAEVNALHSAEYRARKGIPDPVLPTIPPHVNDNAPKGSDAARPTVSIPSSTGMAPAAPAPEAPVSGTPALPPAAETVPAP
ncbi:MULTISPECIES: VacJ family lipoprotein [unclassified Novosphingobium]|uniref:MlaA family lipoprotein n=1 Tax=unclassified Novosphingobium TaxID=2644732 RepID=UPI00190F0EB1|nr:MULTISPECIES: VacJ family lipoprotein [unclassified Novosphingobium]